MSLVRSSVSGLNNYSVKVPGTTVTAHLGVWDHSPSNWVYSLWDEGDNLIAVGELDFKDLNVTDEQVARIAFLLECEYPKG